VELADDLVRSSVGGDEGPSLREIEVELIEGTSISSRMSSGCCARLALDASA